MDEQVELLRGIWNEMKALNGRVTTTNEQLGEVRAEMRAGFEEVRGSIQVLGDRIELVHSRSVERDLHIATALANVAGEVHELRGEMHELRGDVHGLRLDVRDLKSVVFEWHDEHRADRTNLEERVERLERHVGIEPR